MSDTIENETPASKSPTHIAYHVRDYAGKEPKKSFWNRIGVAWVHGDGQGFNLDLTTVPLDGRITVRVAAEKKD